MRLSCVSTTDAFSVETLTVQIRDVTSVQPRDAHSVQNADISFGPGAQAGHSWAWAQAGPCPGLGPYGKVPELTF